MKSFRWSASYLAAGAVAAVLTLSAQVGVAQTFCVGDCNSSDDVDVSEIVTMVNAALTGGDGGCANGDPDSSGDITVDEIITAVNNALEGCGERPTATATIPGGDFTPTPTTPPTGGICGNGVTDAGEDCDNGGVCAGGESSNSACDSEDDCAGNLGACIGGADNLRGCVIGQAGSCPNGTCVKCRPVGGDGCAQNCTNETRIPYPFKPGVIDGLVISDGSGATVYGPFLSVPLAFSGGSQVLTVGRSRDGGPIPVVVKAADIDLPRIPVQTIACACVRGVTAQTCGGTVFDENGELSTNCTPGFEMQETCPTDRPCAPIHGEGNTGSGYIGCAAGSTEYSVDVTQDCNGTAGEPPFDPVATITESGTGSGAAYMILSGAIGTVVGACTGMAPDYGPDQQFCTGDDDPGSFGTPNPIPLTTGSATGLVLNPADFEGDTNGPWTTSGARFTCSGNDLTSATGGNLAGVFTSCDQPTINDIVVPNNFEAQ
ncbi:MAG TPA: hypothetical protein VEB21_07730 [Terriglobales bacterium]|nr:hypothetical protein [Terriglobales bacterium]